MRDKVVVITGGAGGIGFATAEMLLKVGAKVVIADNNLTLGQSAERSLMKISASVKFIQTDVTKLESAESLMTETVAEFGGIDALFNNAGVLGGNRFPESDPQAWGRAIDVNILGLLNCIHSVVPHLKNKESSYILNMGSTAGLKSSHLDPVYAMTKAAVVNLTRSLIFMLEENGIRINCLCPTLVKTELAKNTSSGFSTDEFARFTERRGGRNERPSLTTTEVADAAVKLITNQELNGYCVEMTLDNHWNPIAPILPHKV